MYVRNKEPLTIKSQNTGSIKKTKKKKITFLAPIFHIQSIPSWTIVAKNMTEFMKWLENNESWISITVVLMVTSDQKDPKTAITV